MPLGQRRQKRRVEQQQLKQPTPEQRTASTTNVVLVTFREQNCQGSSRLLHTIPDFQYHPSYFHMNANAHTAVIEFRWSQGVAEEEGPQQATAAAGATSDWEGGNNNNTNNTNSAAAAAAAATTNHHHSPTSASGSGAGNTNTSGEAYQQGGNGGEPPLPTFVASRMLDDHALLHPSGGWLCRATAHNFDATDPSSPSSSTHRLSHYISVSHALTSTCAIVNDLTKATMMAKVLTDGADLRRRYGLSHVELRVKDHVRLSRGDMYLITHQLRDRILYQGMDLELLHYQLSVEELLFRDEHCKDDQRSIVPVGYGIVTSHTLINFVSPNPIHYIVLELSKEMWNTTTDGRTNLVWARNKFLRDFLSKQLLTARGAPLLRVVFTGRLRPFSLRGEPIGEVVDVFHVEELTLKTSQSYADAAEQINVCCDAFLEKLHKELRQELRRMNGMLPLRRKGADGGAAEVDREGSRAAAPPHGINTCFMPCKEAERREKMKSALSSPRQTDRRKRRSLELPANLRDDDPFVEGSYFTCSQESNTMECLLVILEWCREQQLNEHLSYTGISITVLSAGKGVYDVSNVVVQLACIHLHDLGIERVNVVCMGRPPLHVTPLLVYSTKDVTLLTQSHIDSEHRTPCCDDPDCSQLGEKLYYESPAWMRVLFYYPRSVTNSGSVSFDLLSKEEWQQKYAGMSPHCVDGGALRHYGGDGTVGDACCQAILPGLMVPRVSHPTVVLPIYNARKTSHATHAKKRHSAAVAAVAPAASLQPQQKEHNCCGSWQRYASKPSPKPSLVSYLNFVIEHDDKAGGRIDEEQTYAEPVSLVRLPQTADRVLARLHCHHPYHRFSQANDEDSSRTVNSGTLGQSTGGVMVCAEWFPKSAMIKGVVPQTDRGRAPWRSQRCESYGLHVMDFDLYRGTIFLDLTLNPKEPLTAGLQWSPALFEDEAVWRAFTSCFQSKDGQPAAIHIRHSQDGMGYCEEEADDAFLSRFDASRVFFRPDCGIYNNGRTLCLVAVTSDVQSEQNWQREEIIFHYQPHLYTVRDESVELTAADDANRSAVVDRYDRDYGALGAKGSTSSTAAAVQYSPVVVANVLLPNRTVFGLAPASPLTGVFMPCSSMLTDSGVDVVSTRSVFRLRWTHCHPILAESASAAAGMDASIHQWTQYYPHAPETLSWRHLCLCRLLPLYGSKPTFKMDCFSAAAPYHLDIGGGTREESRWWLVEHTLKRLEENYQIVWDGAEAGASPSTKQNQGNSVSLSQQSCTTLGPLPMLLDNNNRLELTIGHTKQLLMVVEGKVLSVTQEHHKGRYSTSSSETPTLSYSFATWNFLSGKGDRKPFMTTILDVKPLLDMSRTLYWRHLDEWLCRRASPLSHVSPFTQHASLVLLPRERAVRLDQSSVDSSLSSPVGPIITSSQSALDLFISRVLKGLDPSTRQAAEKLYGDGNICVTIPCPQGCGRGLTTDVFGSRAVGEAATTGSSPTSQQSESNLLAPQRSTLLTLHLPLPVDTSPCCPPCYASLLSWAACSLKCPYTLFQLHLAERRGFVSVPFPRRSRLRQACSVLSSAPETERTWHPDSFFQCPSFFEFVLPLGTTEDDALHFQRLLGDAILSPQDIGRQGSEGGASTCTEGGGLVHQARQLPQLQYLLLQSPTSSLSRPAAAGKSEKQDEDVVYVHCSGLSYILLYDVNYIRSQMAEDANTEVLVVGEWRQNVRHARGTELQKTLYERIEEEAERVRTVWQSGRSQCYSS